MSTDRFQCQLSAGDRSAVGITWSCAAVILACVWKAVHPNVPPPNSRESWWAIALRRLYMTLWTILLPEVVVMRAAAQWCEARRTSEVYQEQHPQDTIPLIVGAGNSKDTDQPKFKKLRAFLSSFVSHSSVPGNEPQWTKTHSYFLSMGGFVTTQSDGKRRIIHPADLGVVTGDSTETAPKLPWPMVEEDDIKDKRKGDTITKVLVIWQTTWFVVQIITRAVEGLAVTELEIMTLAYGVLSAFLYVLWWNKPYDIQKPIVIPASQLEEPDPQESTPPTEPLKASDFLLGRWLAQLDTIIFQVIFFLVSPVLKKYLGRVYSVVFMKVGNFLYNVSVYIYCLARIVLIVEPFVLLRDLSPSATQPISWTDLIPHV
ncbi:hypothetical protein AB1N83_009427 [Pleurotus pulmonarius]